MNAFRALLAAIWIAIAGYTAVVIAGHGWNLFPYFFGDMARLGWPGQFNVDFTTMLVLSATWVAWRHRFSPAGLGLGVLAFFGGGLFLSTYLLVLTGRSDDVVELLIGSERASAPKRS